jgi:hypothetical protein
MACAESAPTLVVIAFRTFCIVGLWLVTTPLLRSQATILSPSPRLATLVCAVVRVWSAVLSCC